jgi:hypothetical protein
MSNLFLTNELFNIMDTLTESNVSLPKFVTIVDRANGDNATSTINPNQMGGSYSATSNVHSQEHDVNKLITMLTSESSSNLNGLSQTSTESLENQLRGLLNQDDDAPRQSGGGRLNVEDIKGFFLGLQNQGVDVNVKLNDKSLSEFFQLSQNTTTEMNNSSVTSAEQVHATNVSTTSDNVGQNTLFGGAKNRNKATTQEQEAGAGSNPGFEAFLKLKKHISEKLKISNSPKTSGKIASVITKKLKETHPNKTSVEISELARKEFDSNTEKYKKLLDK